MIAVWGFGSIGRRHAENLLALGEERVGVITRRVDEVQAVSPQFMAVSSLSEFPASRPDALVIASPTAEHLDHLQAALDAQIPRIYLEKPIAHSLAGLQEVSQRLQEQGADLVVGYDLRFDPGIQKVRELLHQEVIGRPCSFHAHVGQYLPDWRPLEDYRKGMSARKDLGGGVMLDLVHECDYLYHLFGEVHAITNANGQRSELEIDTEDVSDSLIEFSAGWAGTLHLDYLQKELTRYVHIVGSRGVIHLDLAARQVRWNTVENPAWQYFSYEDVERNDRFRAVMQAFVGADGTSPLCSWEEGLVSLRMVEVSKQSAASGQRVLMERTIP